MSRIDLSLYPIDLYQNDFYRNNQFPVTKLLFAKTDNSPLKLATAIKKAATILVNVRALIMHETCHNERLKGYRRISKNDITLNFPKINFAFVNFKLGLYCVKHHKNRMYLPTK